MACILSPAGETKLRETLWSETLFLAGMTVDLCVGSCHRRRSQRLSRMAPGKQPALQHRQKPAKQKRRKPDRDNTGIDPLEIENLARRFHHVSDALARVHHLGQNDVGPADVVHDAKRTEDSWKGAE